MVEELSPERRKRAIPRLISTLKGFMAYSVRAFREIRDTLTPFIVCLPCDTIDTARCFDLSMLAQPLHEQGACGFALILGGVTLIHE